MERPRSWTVGIFESEGIVSFPLDGDKLLVSSRAVIGRSYDDADCAGFRITYQL